MNYFLKLLAISAVSMFTLNVVGQPLALHPDNSHYLIYQNKPMLLITSAEHYGAVLNADFDYEKYLSTLHAEGMNYTRIFTGSYVELPGSFGIRDNTLSPATGSFLAPWKRSDQPSLYEGENRFDFDQWNPAYFRRLHDFIKVADQYGIIVEITFFCATYQDPYWHRHPFNPENNINNIGTLVRQDFNTLKNATVVKYQKKLVKKLLLELNKYDNIFFELCNEPWADNGRRTEFLHKTLIPKEDKLGWLIWATAATTETLVWQEELAKAIKEIENGLPKKHLLAQNYSNFKENLIEVDPNIDIINFHYAWPESVTENFGWDRPINFDESGFAGTADTTYLQQAWAFLMSGGAIFNNLDYSFYVGKEDGTGINEAPGGGSTNFRRQLRFLHDFLQGFNLVDLSPSSESILHSPGLDAYCLADKNSYAIYLQGRNQGNFKGRFGPGKYQIICYNPDNGDKISEYNLTCSDAEVSVKIPKLNRVAIAMKQI